MLGLFVSGCSEYCWTLDWLTTAPDPAITSVSDVLDVLPEHRPALAKVYGCLTQLLTSDKFLEAFDI